ncbi:hypothetical protein QP684_04630 [Alloscardovia omnicolens]|uniref:hypothetical protein n=1 Tax=Alloscardovia omnicolens TaxID=419015 RepID=UPI00066734D1|nr:hypothetical protein [Alloscardovia omnicolens]MBS6346395.1 hypothetical protein [Alloscardovia omnicolens]MDK8073802.1 hypothetical protein [Alloscardovia omnicolens]
MSTWFSGLKVWQQTCVYAVVLLIINTLIKLLFEGWASLFTFVGIIQILGGVAISAFFMWLVFRLQHPHSEE